MALRVQQPKKRSAGPKRVAHRTGPGNGSSDMEQFFSLADMMFVRLDRAGRVLNVNRTTCRILGLPKKRIVGKNWFAHFIPRHLQAAVRATFRQLLSGRLVPVEFYENSVLTSRGEERTIAWHNAIIHDEQGRISGALSAGTDVTVRRQTERNLAESEENLRVTLNSIGDAVIVTDRRGHISMMNPTAQRLTGWSLDEARGKPIDTVFRIVSAKDGRPAKNPFHTVMKKGKVVGLANHTVLLAKDERRFHIADSAAPIRHPRGPVHGVVLVFRDVTDAYRAQESLRESEQRLRNFFDSAMDGVLVANAETRRIVTANPAMLRMLGCTWKDLDGQGIDAIHPPPYLPMVRDMFDSIARKRLSLAANVPVVRKGGSIFSADIHASPILFDGRRCVLGIFRDVTPRREAEEALRESEARFRRIIETCPWGVHLYRLTDDGALVFTGANPAADRILGVANAQFIGKTIEEAFPPLKDTDIPAVYRRVALTGCPWSGEQPYEHDRIHGVFDVRIFQTTHHAMAAMFEDITPRRMAEDALRNSENRYRTLAENLPDMILQLARDGRVLFANANLLQALGLPYMPQGYGLASLGLDRPLQESLESGVAEVLRSGAAQSLSVACTLGTRDVFLDVRLVPEHGRDDRPEAVLVTLRDMTAFIRMEERLSLAEKMEAVGRLAGSVAHDFNNQLAGIAGFAAMLKQTTAADPHCAEHVDGIVSAVRRAADLTSQLLSFSRKGKTQRVTLDLDEVLREIIALLRRSVSKRIDIRYTPPPHPFHVLGDPTQLETALLNIGLNARDAMSDGGSLTIGADACQLDVGFGTAHAFEITPGPHARIAFADTGTGMSPETMKHLFEPFFTTKAKGQGTGMGLPAVYATVKNHGGAIDIQSTLGHGTTFSVYIPLAPADGPAAPAPQEANAPLAPLPIHVLVVDDEDIVAHSARFMLKAIGADVTLARTGTEALEVYAKSPGKFQAVILDMILPDLSGEAVFAGIRAADPKAVVILSSGYSADGAIEALLRDGAAGFLQKPFDLATLHAALSCALAPGKPA